MDLPVQIRPYSAELPETIRLDRDTRHHSYDREYANRLGRILAQVDRVFTASQCAFIGKSSPVNFFWGSFDLAVTRFSGRRAPLREGPAFMRDAYSHEVISHGFWPGSGEGTLFGPGPVDEPAFYGYAAPVPAGFDSIHVEPAGAFYHRDLGEYILPYAVVRRSADPDQAIYQFIETTYAGGADLAGWDRAALERAPLSSVP